MSNHFSAANLKSPGDDPRLDLTDLFVFPSATDPDKTVLIIDSNPFMAAGSTFNPDAVYRINIDNNGDIQPDVAFSFMFTDPSEGPQTAAAVYASNRSQAQQAEPAGEVLTASVPVDFDGTAQPVQAGPVLVFTGVRSDPFFADIEGALHGFKWTGQDGFAGKNVLSIALEVPNDMLGNGQAISVWATVSLRRDGTLVQMDRGGNPTINPFINPDDAKDEYNSRQPVDDVANYLAPWSQLLQDKGGRSPDDARAAALTVLPDVLNYDHAQTPGYPNGRLLTDDVYSDRFAWLSNGQIPPDGLKPHDDLTAHFPYLALPNSSRNPLTARRQAISAWRRCLVSAVSGTPRGPQR